MIRRRREVPSLLGDNASGGWYGDGIPRTSACPTSMRKASLIELRRPPFPKAFPGRRFGANTGNSRPRNCPIWRAFVDGSDGTRTRDLRRDRCVQTVSAGFVWPPKSRNRAAFPHGYVA